MTIDDVTISISGGLLSIASVRDEPYECLRNVEGFIEKLKREKGSPDLFSFLQALPDREPRHQFYYEPASFALLPITTYENWWKKQIHDKTRNLIRKSQKQSVELRLVPFDDGFVRGVKAIYDECPVRQGKPFKHYQKEFETVKSELATFPGRSEFIGAFCEDEMIGFAKFVSGDVTASLMQIMSTIGDRNKAPTNALISKAVELCANRNIPYLHYGIWSTGGLGMFKENHGFERYVVPRYFVPLSLKGRLMLKLGLHRRLADYLPARWRERIIVLRNKWTLYRCGQKSHKWGGSSTGRASRLM